MVFNFRVSPMYRTKLSFASKSREPLKPRNLGPCPFLDVCKLQISQPSLSAFRTVPWHSPLPSPEQPTCSARLVPLPGQPPHSEPTLRPVQLLETSPGLRITGHSHFLGIPKHRLLKESHQGKSLTTLKLFNKVPELKSDSITPLGT